MSTLIYVIMDARTNHITYHRQQNIISHNCEYGEYPKAISIPSNYTQQYTQAQWTMFVRTTVRSQPRGTYRHLDRKRTQLTHSASEESRKRFYRKTTHFCHSSAPPLWCPARLHSHPPSVQNVSKKPMRSLTTLLEIKPNDGVGVIWAAKSWDNITQISR